MTPVPSPADTTAESQLYTRVTQRLIPFLFCCYGAAYLDRVNIGFAKLQMLNELRFSETVYGLGAGIFFIGYFLFEIPSNIILHRVGARRWIARVMLTWAIISAAMVFVRTPTVFYILRFLLGVAEAGFFPGIILYLTYWFPVRHRAKMMALFIAAVPLTGVVGNPLSGATVLSMLFFPLHIQGSTGLMPVSSQKSISAGYKSLPYARHAYSLVQLSSILSMSQ